MPRLLVSFLFVLLFVPLSAAAAENGEYRDLRAARPDGRTVSVSDLVIERDVFRIHFRSGSVHFLAPVAGRTVGLVFIGDGSYELSPATEGERRHLELVTGENDLEKLTDRFDSIVLLFGDDTAGDILRHAPAATGAPDARATSIYEQYLKEQRNRYRLNLHLRVLRDLLNETEEGVFLGAVNGKSHPPALIVHDPLGIGNVGAQYRYFGGEESALIIFELAKGGVWYLSATRDSAIDGHGKPHRAPADAIHYEIDTTIQGNQISATTTIRFRLLEDGVRVLPLNLLPKLRLTEAFYRVEGGEKIPAVIVQEEVELGKFARLFRLEVADADAAVIFAEPLAQDTSVELTLAYGGRDVLVGLSTDAYSVNARDSWYPNLGNFTDLATYELTFRYPRRNHLISVGERVSEREEQKQKVAVWRAATPIRVAGFNYGRFEKKSHNDEQSGMSVDVYSHRNYTKMADAMLADAINSARVGAIFFGPAPYSPVSVTQQPEWNFGQSWPGLVYLPTLAFTTSTERVFGFDELPPGVLHNMNEFAKMVGWHELAHQWWGHHVGWESYRDQWLSEGLAEFTAALVLQFTESYKKYDDYWERQRREIIAKPRGSQVRNFEAGAVSQGFRLGTHRSPTAAHTIVYGKGGYVVHMLRMMMRGGTNPDERFITMMRDFVDTHAGANPSTADFKTVVERHMTPQMNLTGDGSMDWFFDQWIYGTHIPRITSDIKVTDAGGGKYRLNGSVTQSDVPDGFRTPVPIYVDFGGDKIARIGVVPVVGSQSASVDVELALPAAPRRVAVNLMHDILTVD